MILYSVTVSIDPAIEAEWIQWMKENHIPAVMKSECFDTAHLSRVNGEEEGGITYNIIYKSPSKIHFEQYQNLHAPQLQKEHHQKYEGKYAAFRTVLDIVEEFKA